MIVPSVSSSHTTLRAVSEIDTQWLHELAMSGENLIRWRFQGRSVSLEEFRATLWAGVHTQFIVCSKHSGEPRALVVSYEAHGHHVKVACVASPNAHATGIAMEAMPVFTDYLFENRNFLKIYYEMTESNFASMPSVGEIGQLEGRFVQHVYRSWRFEDLLVFGLHRDDWLRIRDRWSRLWVDGHSDTDSEVTLTDSGVTVPDPGPHRVNGASHVDGHR
jgi:RimJ/RimL family protein N-acetyltransferase